VVGSVVGVELAWTGEAVSSPLSPAGKGGCVATVSESAVATAVPVDRPPVATNVVTAAMTPAITQTRAEVSRDGPSAVPHGVAGSSSCTSASVSTSSTYADVCAKYAIRAH
jgi:hypothetical protein